MRDVLVVPETKVAVELLREFQERRRQIAIVVDEFGSTLGMVTAEDVLEQVVGELEDEFDIAKVLPLAAPGGGLLLDGSASLRDLVTQLHWRLPREAGVETLAGLLLMRLGHLPAPGESVDIDGRRFTVVEVDRRRISKVRVEELDGAPPDAANEEPRTVGTKG
jgi:CBS domain containing-hemolysin-like protein